MSNVNVAEVVELIGLNGVWSSRNQAWIITWCFSFPDDKTKKLVYMLQVKPQYGKEINFVFSDEEVKSYNLDNKEIFEQVSKDLFGKKVEFDFVKKVHFED